MAAVAAGVTGAALVALVAWQWSDGGWWAVVTMRLTVWLAVGKVGFKVALAVVFGVVALTAWLARRRTRPAPGPGTAPGPDDGDA